MLSSRQKGWIGVDLGTSAVKLAQVERVGPRWRLAHARVIRRDTADSAEQSVDNALEWWDEVCRRESLREGFVGRRAACTLPTWKVDLRAMNVPEGSQAEQRAMIANELDSLSAEGVGRRVFDFWDTRPPGESNLETVNVISVAEDEVTAVAAGLARGGLRLRVIDGLPLALARAVEMVGGADGAKPVAVVDWGSSSATFSVICSGRPVFTRHLRDCGFAAMPAAVSESLGLSIEDAQQLLATHGVPDPANRSDPLRDVQEVLADVTSGSVNALVTQLDKTLAYPELHRSGLVPQRLWLMGGGATVRNVAAMVSARIRLPVETWRLSDHGPEARSPAAPPEELLGPAMALSALAFAA